jgi:hypothetical protein
MCPLVFGAEEEYSRTDSAIKGASKGNVEIMIRLTCCPSPYSSPPVALAVFISLLDSSFAAENSPAACPLRWRYLTSTSPVTSAQHQHKASTSGCEHPVSSRAFPLTQNHMRKKCCLGSCTIVSIGGTHEYRHSVLAIHRK